MNESRDDLRRIEQHQSGYADLIGYKLRAKAAGYVELELAIEPKHLNRLHVPHGGVLATLIDTATGYAVALMHGPERIARAVTISLSMQFLGQAKVGDVLVATGRHVGGGRTIGYATAEIHSADGRAIARGDATLRILSQKQ